MLWSVSRFFKDFFYNPSLEMFGEDFPFRVFFAVFMSFITLWCIGLIYFLIHVVKMFIDENYRAGYAFQHTRRLWVQKIVFHQRLDAQVEKQLERESIDLSQNLRWYHYVWVPDLLIGFMQEVTTAAGRTTTTTTKV